MTLRSTLIMYIGLVLLASLLAGSVLVYWHAVRKVDVEMRAAMAVGEHTVHNAIDDVEEAAMPMRQLRLLVGDLDGDRHLRGTLYNANGSILARSTPLEPDDATPDWFFKLLRYEPQVTRIQLPTPFGIVGTIVLETDPRNEISEVWSDVMLTLTVLAIFFFLIAVLIFWSTGRALRPLSDMIRACERIGAGDYTAKLAPRGPQELQQLGEGFNQMSSRLSDIERRKSRLEEQLVAVQEEERSELAQDLHDEVGPLLFAVNVDMAAIQQSAALQTDSAASDRLLAMREAITRIQGHVKTILVRLRPPTVADLGLAHSIQRLVSFWRTRYPAVTFNVDTPEDPVDSDMGSNIYRIIQESISNALKHGQPSLIDVQVQITADDLITVRVVDNGKGLKSSDGPTGGLGLRGMRDRVEALGGRLSVASVERGSGVVVCAELPLAERVA